MKIRNVILALALAIFASFSFTTTLNANTADIPVIEEGVNGVIEVPMVDNNNLVIRVSTKQAVQLSIFNSNNQKVWSTKTNQEYIVVPTNNMASGYYTIIAKVGHNVEYHTVHIAGNTPPISNKSTNTQF